MLFLWEAAFHQTNVLAALLLQVLVMQAKMDGGESWCAEVAMVLVFISFSNRNQEGSPAESELV